jgi:hypothetical protein
MFFSELKNRLKLITDNLSLEEVKKKRKELMEEFANPEDFNLPQSDLEIKDKNYTYTTQLWAKNKSIQLKTIIDEKKNESVVLFKINNSYDKLESQTTKTTIDIIAVVSLNFLHYVSICNKDPLNIVFVAENESLARIDNMLLSLCTKLYPFVTFNRRVI